MEIDGVEAQFLKRKLWKSKMEKCGSTFCNPKSARSTVRKYSINDRSEAQLQKRKLQKSKIEKCGSAFRKPQSKD